MQFKSWTIPDNAKVLYAGKFLLTNTVVVNTIQSEINTARLNCHKNIGKFLLLPFTLVHQNNFFNSLNTGVLQKFLQDPSSIN